MKRPGREADHRVPRELISIVGFTFFSVYVFCDLYWQNQTVASFDKHSDRFRDLQQFS